MLRFLCAPFFLELFFWGGDEGLGMRKPDLERLVCAGNAVKWKRYDYRRMRSGWRYRRSYMRFETIYTSKL